jgi:subfamily B ATP-binding cassette protein MsbA
MIAAWRFQGWIRVDNFTRLFPFLRAHRRRLIFSLICGVIVAVLWGGNLTVAFPIVQLLFEKKSVEERVSDDIREAAGRMETAETKLQQIDKTIEELQLQSLPDGDERLIAQQNSKVKQQKLYNEAARDHGYRLWIQQFVMPWVPRNQFKALLLVLGLLTAATMLKCFFVYLQDVAVGSVAELVVIDVRKKLLRRTLKLDYQFFSREGTAQLMSRFTYDTEQLAASVRLVSGKLVREPLKCFACLVGAMVINWRLTLLSLLVLPFIGYAIARVGKLLKKACRGMLESMSKIYKNLEETFDGIKVVMAFNTASRHRDVFQKQCDVYYGTALKVTKLDALNKPVLELLGTGAMLIALLPGAYLIMREKTDIWGIRLSADVMTPATLATLYAMLAGMLDPCRKVSNSYSVIKKANAAIDRIFAVIDSRTAVPEPEKPVELPRPAKSIDFQNITFRYSPREGVPARECVLDGLSLSVKVGEVVAIVGGNGCGKSTLLNLLLRYADPQAGQIKIDGVSICDVTLADLRRQIGFVAQDTILFDETILENIRYGSPDATREQVEAAARAAHVTSFVERLPEGFDTRVGEKGKELSGGQRQRIALARAILRDPAILILDEPTSAIDAESETLIHETLKEFTRGRTTFLVTHSMSESLLRFVTRCVVMASGKVVADGQHGELLKTCPLYSRLFEAPSRIAVAGAREAA